MKASSTQRFLIGKTLPGGTSVIRQIFARGNERIVVLADQTRTTLSKTRLKNQMQEVMSEVQRAAMARTIRRKVDGTVRMTLGGTENGTRKTYVSEAAAKQALTRRYGK